MGEEPTIDDATRFTETLAETLGVDPECVLPAFEDPLTFIAREQRLPDNVDMLESKLEDAEERTRLARVFERGLGKPVGFALRLQRWNTKDGGGWRSEKWRFRRRHLYLVPGDSPVGFRLPLESLPHVPPESYPYFIPADPFAALRPFGGRRRAETRSPAANRPAEWRQRVAVPPQLAPIEERRQTRVEQDLGDGRAVRTALSVEICGGRLNVFLPPTESAADYVDLVSAIEATSGSVSSRGMRDRG